MQVSSSGGQRYDAVSIALHWVTAVLVVVVIALIELKGWFPKGSMLRDAMKFWHFQLGAFVLLLGGMRLIWALLAARPEPLAAPGSLERRLGAIAHGALYLALFLLPLSGLIILIIAGKPVAVFGIDLPVRVPGDRPVAKAVEEVHEFFGNAMMALIGLHAAAALWHHYLRRDATLTRMLPKWR